MPLSPEYAAGLTDQLVAVYQEAEQVLLGRIARALAANMDAPDWAERKLLQMQLLQAQTVRQVAELTGKSSEEIAAAIVRSYNRGAAMAEQDLAELVARSATAPMVPPGLPAVEGLVSETVAHVQLANQRILRAADDIYRQVIASAAPQVLLGTQTRREAAQSALNRFANRGITGFVDSRGRQWAMESYVEMSMRAGVMNAQVQGHVERLLSRGQDLVIVSDAPQECALCRPWEGKVLSLTGSQHVDVRVAGTLDAARSAGLFHPGCRHSVSLFIQGVTKRPTDTADAASQHDREHLRSRERQVRKWKRREAVALDDAAREQARAKVRHYQAQIREHVASSSAKRQRHREQLGAL
ncbi:capsid protein [Aeromicrobium phragmitis]|uniref:Capsid protein n=1 Tax=Aeromicrobium phragmitis TaxID=2478914 RepID=A0A3L8PPV6_9ACTN|nr:phage minor capsid protein [Aeromicrobium phragmitis]RLV56052.1 capsid protein [Aeromicrobium phragmitis]